MYQRLISIYVVVQIQQTVIRMFVSYQELLANSPSNQINDLHH